MAGSQRHTCLVGGSRSGKTFLFVRAAVIRAMRAPGSRHLFARFRANAVRASVRLDTYRTVLRECFPGLRSHSSEGYEELPNGSQIWFGGLDEKDRVEKILGMEFATIYAGECSQIPYSSILVLRTRLAQVCKTEDGRLLPLRGFYDLNPTTIRHWTYVEFVDKRDPISNLPLARPEDYAMCYINPEHNAANLDPGYLADLRSMSPRFRERFYEGRYTVEVEGALWKQDLLELRRVEQIEPDKSGRKLGAFQRICVGVDPSGAQSKEDIKSDEIGIVVVGKRHDGRGVVLEDATLKGGPKDWGRATCAMYHKWKADVIAAEANYGGAMVESTIRAVDPNVKVELVNASRGKVQRAEPIAALFEEDKMRLAGRFDKLEDQLCDFTTAGYVGSRSPDRADAMIWAATHLMLADASTYTLRHVR